MAGFDLTAYLAERGEAVNRALTDRMDAVRPGGRLVEAMRYSLMAGGKRLRPVLCLAAAAATGGDEAAVMPAACALEMIHTYSLIHDDLPAMDDDDLRRGRPTCHIQFDEATAILAGDALLTLAFEVLADAAQTDVAGRPDRAGAWIAVIREIATAAGAPGMVEGQMRDMAAEKEPLNLDTLAALHGFKTGAMIRVSARAGALLSGADPSRLGALTRYAERIGLSFQVTDDILNVTGDSAEMGKATGTDAVRGKSTYPSLLGLEESRALAARLTAEAIEALEGFGDAAAPLAAIAEYILKRRK